MMQLRLKVQNAPKITYGVIFLLILFSFITRKFYSGTNLLLIARYSCVLVVASVGMFLVILMSQIDMSIGSVMSLCGVVMALCLNWGMSIPLAFLVTILAGMLIGLINGVCIAYWNLDFWIITFGMMSICAGLALVFSNGATVTIANQNFSWLCNGKFLGIYIMVYVTLFLLIAMVWILKSTRFGYNIYSIGGSELCARLCGINVVKNRIIVYVVSGLFASIAGAMLASMGNSASPTSGNSYSFDAMAAVIIGGAAFSGGKGTLLGTVMGALLLRVLANGLNLMGIPATWQQAIIGIITVLILVAEVLQQKQKKLSEERRRYVDEK